MLTVERAKFLSVTPKKQLQIYFDYHVLMILSLINLICKIIVLAGLIITIFSNHWAKSPQGSNIYAGYKARCTVHTCLVHNPDPTWLVDLIFILAVINLSMELINISIIGYFRKKINRIDILLGLMFILTFIITDCGIVFGIHIASFVYQSSMGYAFYYFMIGIIFSIADWGLSLKRFISDWPEMICLTEQEHKQISVIQSTNYSPPIPEKEHSISLSHLRSYRGSSV